MKIFLRKISTIINYYKAIHAIVLFIPLLPVVILIRLIRPFLLIRFGAIENQRIGHYMINPELYLCERDAGLKPNKSFDIFYNMDPTFTSNSQLEKMWKRSEKIRLWEIARFLCIVNRCLPGYRKHLVVLPNIYEVIHDLYGRFPVHISFTEDEEQEGQKALRRMGIPEDAKFVCFHSRDPEYLNTAFPGGKWGYHSYRDSKIDHFLPAMEELSRRGYYAIRIGAVVREPIETNNPYIIDYSARFRTEFLDIYLGAKCVFYFGDSCGINTIPLVFGRPIISTNFIPLEYIFSWNEQDISIIKKLWLRKEKRFMTLSEIMESGAGKFVHAYQYEEMGIDIVENSPEEIIALAVEADERLRGIHNTAEEDEELQKLFWCSFKSNSLNKTFRAHIGADFLRKNRFLLE